MTESKNFLELFLQPLTPLVFGRTRTLETSGITYSYYPLPPPSTVAGMIRSVILEYFCEDSSKDLLKCFKDHKNVLGNYGEYTGMGWVLVGPYLARLVGSEVKVYYPQPIDTVIIERKDNRSESRELEFLVIQENLDEYLLGTLIEHFMDSHKYTFRDSLIPIPINREKKSEQKGEYAISAELMKHYLSKNYKTLKIFEVDSMEAVAISSIVKKREEVGIALDEQKQVAIGMTPGGMLYKVERLYYDISCGWGMYVAIYSKDSSIIEKIKSIFAKNDVIARLGGKGGLVKIYVVEKSDLIEKDSKYTQTNKRSRLILTSPALLNDQYVIPRKITRNKIMGLFNDEIITGWSLAKNAPRRTFVGVKSGSIFIIEPESTLSVFSRDYVFPGYENLFGSALIGEI